jgi:hypothetical protein
MNRRSVLSVSAVMALAVAVMPSSVVAQEKSLKDQLVGTWIFVSAQDVKPDGTKVDPWGPNPKGVAMYDAKRRFTFMIMPPIFRSLCPTTERKQLRKKVRLWRKV